MRRKALRFSALRRLRGLLRSTGARMLLSYFSALLAHAHLIAGQRDAGLAAADEALEIVDSHGERFYLAEIWRLKGILQPRTEPSAEACLRRAMDLARNQGARALELRAAVDLAELWHQQGKREEARQLLESVRRQFTEGFDSADFQHAGQLLDRCAASPGQDTRA